MVQMEILVHHLALQTCARKQALLLTAVACRVPVTLPASAACKTWAFGSTVLCVVLFDGSLECAGSNFNRMSWQDSADWTRTLGSASALAGMPVSSAGSGLQFSCVLSAVSNGSNRVLCIGDGRLGQLGAGKLRSSTVPVAVQGLKPSRIAQLAVGPYYSCVAYAAPDSLVQCWGQLFTAGATAIPGTAGATAIAVGKGEGKACAVMRDSTVTCWWATEATVVGGLKNVVRVAAGGAYGCAIVQGEGSAVENSSWCWKMAETSVGRIMANTALLNTPHRVEGLPPAVIVDVVTGSTHACVLLREEAAVGGDVHCWGLDDRGQLGQGYITPVSNWGRINETEVTTRPLRVGPLSDITRLYAGTESTCAVTASQKVMCWGSNGGMLATGDDNSVVSVPTAMQGLCA